MIFIILSTIFTIIHAEKTHSNPHNRPISTTEISYGITHDCHPCNYYCKILNLQTPLANGTYDFEAVSFPRMKALMKKRLDDLKNTPKILNIKWLRLDCDITFIKSEDIADISQALNHSMMNDLCKCEYNMMEIKYWLYFMIYSVTGCCLMGFLLQCVLAKRRKKMKAKAANNKVIINQIQVTENFKNKNISQTP